MASLIKYEAACLALAEAHSVDEVKDIGDKAEAMRIYGIQSRNVDLEIMAADIRIRSRRRLGQLIAEMREAGTLSEGGRPTKKPGDGHPPVSLADQGVDKDLAKAARKAASLSEQAFEAMVAAKREQIRREREPTVNRATAHDRVEPRGSADLFPTPPWATRALVEHVLKHLRRDGQCKFQTVWEPACGLGHMAEPLTEYFKKVYASDLHGYGYGDADTNFLTTKLDGFDWIITNPPFGDRTEAFVLRALELDVTGVAMFVRLQWLETVGRYERIFKDRPPSQIAIFSERVPIHKGKWDPNGDTLTAYIWALWIKNMPPQPLFWIPPGCREALTKPDDAARFGAPPPAEAAE